MLEEGEGERGMVLERRYRHIDERQRDKAGGADGVSSSVAATTIL